MSKFQCDWNLMLTFCYSCNDITQLALVHMIFLCFGLGWNLNKLRSCNLPIHLTPVALPSFKEVKLFVGSDYRYFLSNPITVQSLFSLSNFLSDQILYNSYQISCQIRSKKLEVWWNGTLIRLIWWPLATELDYNIYVYTKISSK